MKIILHTSQLGTKRHAVIAEIELEEKVDVVFSNAVLHWILNHKKVFEQFW